MKNILVPLSLWDPADVVVEQSVLLAKAFGSKIHLLHIVPTPDLVAKGSWPRELRERRSNEIERLRREIEARRDRLKKQGIKAETVLVESEDIAAAILEQAEEVEADVIVMGSHEHGVLYKTLLGDIATDILRGASCLVTMVPMKLVEKEHEKRR